MARFITYEFSFTIRLIDVSVYCRRRERFRRTFEGEFWVSSSSRFIIIIVYLYFGLNVIYCPSIGTASFQSPIISDQIKRHVPFLHQLSLIVWISRFLVGFRPTRQSVYPNTLSPMSFYRLNWVDDIHLQVKRTLLKVLELRYHSSSIYKINKRETIIRFVCSLYANNIYLIFYAYLFFFVLI